MEKSSVDSLLETSLSYLNGLLKSSRVVGEVVNLNDHQSIVVISKLSFGYGIGGSEKNSNEKNSQSLFPFKGISSGAVTITPTYFIFVNQNEIKILSSESNLNFVEKLVDFVMNTLDKKN